MKEYLVIIDGGGGGCDYTIDCNKTWEFVEAKNIDEAIAQVIGPSPSDPEDEDDAYDYSAHWSRYQAGHESAINDIQIFEINTETEGKSADVGELCEEYQQEFQEMLESAAVKEKEASEKAQYEILKKKYG